MKIIKLNQIKTTLNIKKRLPLPVTEIFLQIRRGLLVFSEADFAEKSCCCREECYLSLQVLHQHQ